MYFFVFMFFSLWIDTKAGDGDPLAVSQNECERVVLQLYGISCKIDGASGEGESRRGNNLSLSHFFIFCPTLKKEKVKPLRSDIFPSKVVEKRMYYFTHSLRRVSTLTIA